MSSVCTRARLALGWKWVVRRPCDPPPPTPHGIRLAGVEWPHQKNT